MNHNIIALIPIVNETIAGTNLQLNYNANIDPVNAKPIQVPTGAEMTIIASQNDLELTGKYASTNNGP